jgi:hypothetical protein
MQDGGIELPPGDLAPVGRVAGTEISEDRSRVDGAELQVRRQPRGAVEIGPVPLLRITRKVPAPEPAPSGPRRGLACLRQRQASGQARVLRDRGAVQAAPSDLRQAGCGGRPPAVLRPGPVERRVHLERRPVALGQATRRPWPPGPAPPRTVTRCGPVACRRALPRRAGHGRRRRDRSRRLCAPRPPRTRGLPQGRYSPACRAGR